MNGEVEPPTKLETVPETVKVEVESTTSPAVAGNEELENTKVNVEVPANHPDLPLPENTEDMLKEARRMVSEAAKIGGPSTSKGKRKADEIVDDDEKAAVEGPSAPKKARKAEVELRKERIKRRALTGIAASLAIGYVPIMRIAEIYIWLTWHTVHSCPASWLHSARDKPPLRSLY